MNKTFAKAVEDRRSIYAISKESPVSKEKIEEIIIHNLKYVPSAFHSQSARVVLLFGKHHDMLWNLTGEALRKIVPADSFEQTAQKIQSFRNGFGTILFFEDQSVVEGLQEQFALYRDNFPIWSLQSSGMLQFAIWTALEDAGLGASLQHYNPLIDGAVKESWNVPSQWKLLAQMPFGAPTATPDDKEFVPVEDRFKVFKG